MPIALKNTGQEYELDKVELKKQILGLVEQYSALQYAEKSFTAGTDVIPPSGKIIGAD